jgi:hypothetical protein
MGIVEKYLIMSLRRHPFWIMFFFKTLSPGPMALVQFLLIPIQGGASKSLPELSHSPTDPFGMTLK